MGSITTKTGDKGKTWVGRERVGKESAIVELIGTLDELQSCLGYATTLCPSLERELIWIEELLYHVMAALHKGEGEWKRWVGEIEKRMPSIEPPHTFLIPKGKSAFLHMCRTIARRAERRAVIWAKGGGEKGIIALLNRLSDHLYLLALHCATEMGEIMLVGPERKDSE